MSDDRESLTHVMHVRYEDLTANPAQVLAEIADFLGLPRLEDVSSIALGTFVIARNR